MSFSFRLGLGWLLPLLAALGSSCQTLRPASQGNDNTNSYCAPPEVFTTDTLAATGRTPTPQPPLDTTRLPLSARSWQLAEAYRMGPALTQLTQLAQRRQASRGLASPEYLAYVRQRQIMVLAVTRATNEVLRVASELECERQRADQSAVALQVLTTKRTNHFTVASLLMGVASGAISATLQDNNTNLVLTLITAGLGAGLGVGALLVGPQLPYPLPRNLLAPVWYQSARPALYPPGLWVVLGEVQVGRTGPALPPPLVHLRQRWAQYDQLTHGKSAQQAQQQALYFGVGGAYSLAELRTRSRMLTQLETDVRLVAQDLQKLVDELSTTEP